MGFGGISPWSLLLILLIVILLFGTIVFFDQLSSYYRNRLTEGQGQ